MLPVIAIGAVLAGHWILSGAAVIVDGSDGERRFAGFTSTHSTKSMKLTRGSSLDSCALVALFRLISRKVQRQSSGNDVSLAILRNSSICSSTTGRFMAVAKRKVAHLF